MPISFREDPLCAEDREVPVAAAPAPGDDGQSRRVRVEARFLPDAHAQVRRAAELQGRSLAEFVAQAALTEAQQVIRAAALIDYALEDQRTLLQWIEAATPQRTQPLERALRRRSELLQDF